MTEIVSWTNVTPAARYDLVAWETVIVEEAATETGTFAQIDELALSPVDVDPADPQARNLTTTLGTAPDLWYRLTFKDGSGGLSLPTSPVQNSETAIIDADPYATVDELARILKITSPTVAQTAKLERVLSAAAGEINSELGRVNSDLSGWELDLASQVNLDRAADLWRHTESIPGMTGLLGEGDASALPGRYSWERYAQRLAPMKAEWGLA